MHSQGTGEWTAFSIGPATGDSLTIQSSKMQGNGVTPENGARDRLERSEGKNQNTWIHHWDATLQDASMERLASALQGVLGRPVIDETGIAGSYDFEFGWGEDRVGTVTTALRDQYGLRLSPGKRDLDALIVDSIRRDPALVLLEHVGRMTRGAPPYVRQRIADILTIR